MAVYLIHSVRLALHSRASAVGRNIILAYLCFLCFALICFEFLCPSSVVTYLVCRAARRKALSWREKYMTGSSLTLRGKLMQIAKVTLTASSRPAPAYGGQVNKVKAGVLLMLVRHYTELCCMGMYDLRSIVEALNPSVRHGQVPILAEGHAGMFVIRIADN